MFPVRGFKDVMETDILGGWMENGMIAREKSDVLRRHGWFRFDDTHDPHERHLGSSQWKRVFQR